MSSTHKHRESKVVFLAEIKYNEKKTKTKTMLERILCALGFTAKQSEEDVEQMGAHANLTISGTPKPLRRASTMLMNRREASISMKSQVGSGHHKNTEKTKETIKKADKDDPRADSGKSIRTRLSPDETRLFRTSFSMFASKTNRDLIKTRNLWKVLRASGLAPTPLEFERLEELMDPKREGVIKLSAFLKEMERYLMRQFSDVNELQAAYQACRLLAGEDLKTDGIGVDQVMKAWENLGVDVPEDLDDVEDEAFEMIGEFDREGHGELNFDDFCFMLSHVIEKLT